ncbi:MAG TPA: carboxypeptidase regulatory-like domain-containing protein, partial [Kofleriaceae bacterium]
SADGYADGGQAGRAPGAFEILLTPESSLAGLVLDATTNQPVEGAQVSVGLSESGGEVTRTDARGAFRVARLTPGRIVAVARTERGFGRTEGSVLVGIGEHVEGVVVKLFPAHRIAGRVVIAGTKQPCPDARVTLQPETGDWEVMRPRDDGLLVAEGVLPDTYTPQVRCRGYRARERYEPIVIADRDPVELVWEVEPGSSIRGRVLTKAGIAVEGANLWISASGGTARQTWGGDQSGPDGAYELSGLAAGAYEIDVQTAIGVPSSDGYRVEVADGATVTRDLQLDEGGTMTGVVVDAQGKPLAGITVWARPVGGGRGGMRWGGEQKSDGSGAFTFDSLRAGDYRVTAQRGASDRLRRPGTTDDDKQGEKVTVLANRVVTARLAVEAATGSITGTVTDPAGKPVADAFINAARESDAAGARSSLRDVRWSWDERPVITGTDGTFALTELAPGNYTIRAYRKGGGEAIAEHVAIGQVAKLQIKHTGSIAGLATRAGGVPDQIEVTLNEPATGYWRSETFYKTSGRFTLRDVPKGNYKLTVAGRSGQSQTDVALAEGEARTGVVIELASLVALTGRVVELGTDKPVSGIRMSASLLTGGGFTSGGGGRDEHVTDESGRFKIDGVPRGRLRISGFPSARDSAYHFLSALRDTTTGSADLGDVPIAKRRVKVGDPIGELGVNFADQPDDTPPDKRQFKVSYIDPRGPAAKTELRVGDLIVSVDGVDITGASAALAWPLMRAAPGTKLVLGLARGATVTVTLAAP